MKEKKNILNYFLPIIFLIVLLLPVINSQFKIWEFERVSENRVFNDTLEFDINRLDFFPKEFESYYNDNFSFRTPLLNVYHHTKFSVFKVSPHPDKMIIGTDNWFYMAGKEADVFEGKSNFSQEDLKAFEAEWLHRKKYLDSLNIKPYWIIAPFKHNVYPEYLPFNIYQAKQRRIQTLVNSFQTKLPDLIIDPVPQLLKIKDSIKLYYKLDNHWNFRSGQVVTNMIASRVKKDFPNAILGDLSNYKWDDSITTDGIHHTVLGIDALSERRQYPILENLSSIEADKYGFKCVSGFPYPWDFERRFINPKLNTEKALKVLIIRDSFGEQVIPFMRELFGESVFIFDAWEYKLNEEIIEEFKPDIVIFISLETHLETFIGEELEVD